jgi:hypothetical protein
MSEFLTSCYSLKALHILTLKNENLPLLWKYVIIIHYHFPRQKNNKTGDVRINIILIGVRIKNIAILNKIATIYRSLIFNLLFIDTSSFL